jgi:hypothetical protein
MDAAVSADRDDTPSATVDADANLFLEIANVPAQVYFEREIALAEQFADAFCALAGSAASCGRIEEQVNGLG